MSESASTGPAQPIPPGLRPWKPGQSGNPKGRPKKLVDIAALASEHGPKCVAVVVELLDDPDSRIRLAAAVALLERGFGKPVQPLAGDPDNPLSVRYVIEMPPAVGSKEEWRLRYAPMIAAEPVEG